MDMDEIQLRHFIMMEEDPDELEYFCRQAASKWDESTGRDIQKMMHVIRNSKDLRSKLTKGKKLRIAWACHVLQSCVYSQFMTAEPGNVEKVLEHLLDNLRMCINEQYDRQEELKRRDWVVPLYGNLEADLIINFGSRVMGSKPLEEYLVSMESLYNFASFLMTGCLERGACTFAFVPQCESLEPDIAKFFRHLTKTMKSEPFWSPERKAALNACMNRSEKFLQALTMKTYVTTLEGHSSSLMVPSAGVHNNKASFDNGELDMLPVKELTGPSKDKKKLPIHQAMMNLSGDQAESINSYLQSSAILCAERMQLEKEVLRERQQGQTEKDKQIRKLTRENQALQRKLTNLQAKAKAGAEELSQQKQRTAKAEKAAARLENQESELQKLKAKFAKLQSDLAREQLKNRHLEEENASLENAFFTISNEPGHAEAEEVVSPGEEYALSQLDVSVCDGLSILVIGGHPTFLTGMKQMNANVRYVGVTKPETSAIVNADVIWWQTNCLSHKYYRPIMSIIRNNGIPVRYFTSSGHVQCRIQLIEETKQMIEQGILHPKFPEAAEG